MTRFTPPFDPRDGSGSFFPTNTDMPATPSPDPWWQPAAPISGGLPWLDGFGVDFKRRAVSREALRSIQERSPDARDGRPYPWRLGLFPATGLPAFVRLWLPKPLSLDEQTALREVKEFLSQPIIFDALFGGAISFEQVFRDGPILRQDSGLADKQALPFRHFTWTQSYNGLSVIGGSLRAHGVLGDDRLAVTSSYIPVPDHFTLDPRIPSDLARWRAIQVVALQVPPDERRPLIEALRQQFQATRNPAELADFLKLLAPLLDEQEQDHLARAGMGGLLQARFVPARVGIAGILPDLRRRLQLDIEPARATIIPVGEKEYALMPFAGACRLVSRVQVEIPGEDPWYVEVDMHSGEVPGDAWQAVARALDYFTSSGAAASNIPDGDSSQLITAELNALFRNGTALVSGSNASTESKTVVGNGLRVYHYLADPHPKGMGIDAGRLSGSGFKVNMVAKHTQFDYSSNLGAVKQIGFESSLHARDPEVVMHECVHALLWLFDPDSWDGSPLKLARFGRALQEGYAMYLSRSIAAGSNQNEQNQHWGRAAYGTSNDRWLFPRSTAQPGVDYLQTPITYPVVHASEASLLDYDVGMVWGRALWDLRRLIGESQTDRLVLFGYPYLHGFVANFELAAEALIDADLHLSNNLSLGNGTQAIWASRGISAGQGIHDFAQASNTPIAANNTLIAATDVGVLISTDDGVNWTFDTSVAGGTLAGVVAVAADATTLYAAALLPSINISDALRNQWNAGIYTKSVNDPAWQELGSWRDALTPLRLFMVPGFGVMVCTSHGVHYRPSIGADWERIGYDDTPENETLFVGALRVGSNIVACTSDSICFADTALLNNSWVATSAGQTIFPTAIANDGGAVYVGTLGQGLWRVVAGLASAARVTTTGYNAGDAVLALAIRGPNLYLATSDDVYLCNHANGTGNLSFTALGLPTAGAKIASLFVTQNGTQNDTLLAGTLAHGLYRYAAGWQPATIPLSVTPRTLTLRPGEAGLLGFSLTAAGDYQINLPAGVTLEKVAAPGSVSSGFPLTQITSSANQYTLPQGPCILALHLDSAASPVTLGILPVSANVITVG
jgi:hypothetical protein